MVNVVCNRIFVRIYYFFIKLSAVGVFIKSFGVRLGLLQVLWVEFIQVLYARRALTRIRLVYLYSSIYVYFQQPVSMYAIFSCASDSTPKNFSIFSTSFNNLLFSWSRS